MQLEFRERKNTIASMRPILDVPSSGHKPKLLDQRVKASLTRQGSLRFDLRKRVQQHVQGASFATSYRGPWKLIYYEAYLERDDALGRERYLKSGSGRKFLKAQLAHYLRKTPLRSTRGSK